LDKIEKALNTDKRENDVGSGDSQRHGEILKNLFGGVELVMQQVHEISFKINCCVIFYIEVISGYA